jgi:DNA-binding MarR family transcriptional regulator
MYFATSALARKVEKLAIESWKKVNLSPSHGYLLMLVIENPGIQPSALSAELHLEPSTITRLIDKLEDKKYVARTTDGRLTNVYPSPKAKEMYSRMKHCMSEFYEQYGAILGREETARLVQSMNRISDKMGQ